MRHTEAEGALEGLFSDGACTWCGRAGERLSGEFGLERDELKRCCITGIGPERADAAMELVLRCSEAGERLLIIDMTGNYLGLVGYMPSLRVYRVWRNFQTNPFSASRRGFPELVSATVQAVLRTTRSERVYLERALQLALSQGRESPKTSDILEKLLQIEAEVHPRQGQIIDGLRNALWELQAFDRQIPQKEVLAPALIDIPKACSIMVCRLAAMDLFLNLPHDATGVVIDPADRIFPRDAPEELSEALETSADELAKKGTLLVMANSTTSSLPRWITDTLSSEIRCGTVLRDRDGSKARDCTDPKKQGGKAPSFGRSWSFGGGGDPMLIASRYSESVHAVRIRRTEFKPITDEEIELHMRSLGESFEAHKEGEKKATLLERIFADSSLRRSARDLMALIRGGRVPVDAVTKQRSGALKRVIRTLSKYFLVVEFADGSGTNWYKLTKAGERALEEEEDENEGEVHI